MASSLTSNDLGKGLSGNSEILGYHGISRAVMVFSIENTFLIGFSLLIQG